MQILRKLVNDRRFHRVAGMLALLGLAACLCAWRAGVDLDMLKSWWGQSECFLRQHPVWLFAALVILPGFPVPTSALLFLAGTVWKDQPVFACAVSLAAITLNMGWTYAFAAWPGRRWVEKLIESSGLKIPAAPLGNHLQFLLLLRLTPGFPLFLQNYLLGFFRVPFRLYLPVSLCCTGLISSGVVLGGAGIADGNLKPVFAGVGLIVAGTILIQWIRNRKLRGSV